jgi:HK97 gp10 family phage protein
MASDQLERLKRRLEAIPKVVKEALGPALEKSGAELASRMQTLAPVDTGRLRNSIKVTLPGETTPPYSQPGGSRTAKENEVIVTAGDAKTRYAHLVEYGTTKAPAHPYFWPAFRLTRDRIKRRLKRAVSKAVKENWNK